MTCRACGSLNIHNIIEDIYECQDCGYQWEKNNKEDELICLPLDIYLKYKENAKEPYIIR